MYSARGRPLALFTSRYDIGVRLTLPLEMSSGSTRASGVDVPRYPVRATVPVKFIAVKCGAGGGLQQGRADVDLASRRLSRNR